VHSPHHTSKKFDAPHVTGFVLRSSLLASKFIEANKRSCRALQSNTRPPPKAIVCLDLCAKMIRPCHRLGRRCKVRRVLPLACATVC